MAFFDRSKISPAPFNGLKLQEFGNNDSRGNPHGIDGSETYAINKGAVICFLCDYNIVKYGQTSNRLVTFKGFVEDLQIKLDIKYDDITSFYLPVAAKFLNDYSLGYTLTFNVVAHSVNEAMSNMARFSELDRILHYPFASEGTSNIGSANPENASPESYVFLSNLISNGLLAQDNEYTNINITNAFVRKYGLRTPVFNLKMDPDLEMGVFEYSGKTFFKAFKISLDLPITNIPFNYSYSDEIDNDKKFKTLIPFVKFKETIGDEVVTWWDYKMKKAGGMSDENVYDSRGFPFSIPFDFNILNGDYTKNLGYYPKNKKAKIGLCINSNKITTKGNPYIKKNYVIFNAFLESFSFNRKQEVGITEPMTDIIAKKYTFGATGIVSFDLSFNVVASSVIEAKDNSMKLASLFRMAARGKNEGVGEGPIKALFANLIKGPKKNGSNGNYDFSDIYNNGLPCFITSFGLQIDQDMGYFEENKYFIPKSFKIDMQLIYNQNNTGKIIVKAPDDEDEEIKLYDSADSVKWPFGIKYSNAE